MKKYAMLLILSIAIIASNCNQSNTTTDSEQSIDNQTTQQTQAVKTTKKNILFLGNSITAGYELDPSDAFPNLIQLKIDSLGLDYNVINGGISGETTAGRKARMDWMLSRQSVDILVLELGGNDGLRGIQPDSSYMNLQAIIDQTKEKYPDVKILIAGMEAPPNMGKRFTDEFRGIFKRLADANELPLIPFILDGVAGIRELNLPDGIHPTEEGHKIVSETIWKYLEDLL